MKQGDMEEGCRVGLGKNAGGDIMGTRGHMQMELCVNKYEIYLRIVFNSIVKHWGSNSIGD